MKTIACIFTDEIITDSSKLQTMKKYTYNTEDERLVPGVLIEASNYKRNLQVTHVFKQTFQYVNVVTGEFKNQANHPKDFKLKVMVVGEPKFIDTDVIYVEII